MAKGNRSLWAFLVAEGISLAGNKTTMIALPWLVLTTTGSPAKVGLVAFAQTGCYVAVRALGAPVIDRLGRRRCAIAGSLASAALLGLVPLLWYTEMLPWLVLLAVVGPLGAVQSLSDSAKRLMVPDLVSEAVPLERATSLYSTVERLSFLLGTPAGGLMIAALGPVNVFVIEVVACLVSALLIWLAVAVAETRAQEGEQVPYLRSLREGMRYVRGNRLLVGICVVLFCANLFDQALMAIFVPTWIKDVIGDPRVLGTFAGAFGLGAVIGSLLYAWLGPRMLRYPTFAVGLVLAGSTPFFALAFTDDLVVVLIVVLATGVVSAPINPIISSAIFERVPQPLHARVFGFAGSLAWAGIPLGGIIGGVLVQEIGLRQGLVLLGVLYFAATLLPLLMSSLWQGLNRAEPVPEAST